METSTAVNHLGNQPPVDDTLISNEHTAVPERMTDELKSIFKELSLSRLSELLSRLETPVGKKSFLVLRNNKYVNVLTENIAFFYIKYEAAAIMCFDRQEYCLNYSLEQVQHLVNEKQFFRLNRQYLINFNVVKEVEHSLARKLLVSPVFSIKEKLLVSREKVSEFLHWLDNR